MTLDPLDEFAIEIRGTALREFLSLELKMSIFRDGCHIASCFDSPQETIMHEGNFISRFNIPANVLKPGRYIIGVGAVTSLGNWMWASDVAALNFLENLGETTVERNRGAVVLPYTGERIQ